MEIFEPIKEIATKALERDDKYAYEHALRNILLFIAREDENWRLRKKYYER